MLLALIEAAKAQEGKNLQYETKFVKYAQSEPVTHKRGSSVSYASSYTMLKKQ